MTPGAGTSTRQAPRVHLAEASRVRSAAGARLLTGALALAVVAGVAFRAWMIWSRVGTMDSDEAVWGLMALATGHGHPSTFFWRSNYGGTLEVFLLAPVFLVTGLSIVAMRVVQVLLYAAAAVLVWRVGRRTIGEPGARVAAVLFWVWPAYLVWRSTREYGFYGSALVLSLSSLLIVLRLYERRTARDLALLGLTLGLGWWTTPMCAFVAVPASLWLGVRRPRLLRDLPLVLGAAVVGALPWLVWNIRYHWLSFDALPAGNSYTDRLVEFFASTLPTVLGLRVPWSLAWLTGEVVGRALTVALIGLVVWLALRRREERLEPLLAVAIAFPLLYALSPYAWIVNEPRYLTLLAPVLALLVVAPLSRDGLRAAMLVAATALTGAALLSVYRHDLSRSYSEGSPVPADVQPALRALERRHATRVLAPFWIAYRLTFESHRRVIATSTTVTVRGASDDRLVRTSPHPARVFVAGEPLDRRNRRDLLRKGFVRLVRGGFALYVWPRAGSRGSS